MIRHATFFSCLLIAAATACGGSSTPRLTGYSILVEATKPATAYTEQDAPWRLRFPPDSRTLHLIVQVGNSKCYPLERIDVNDGAQVVTLHAVEARIADPNAACTLELRSVQVDVSLNDPLGHRQLLGCDPRNVEPTPVDCTVPEDNFP